MDATLPGKAQWIDWCLGWGLISPESALELKMKLYDESKGEQAMPDPLQIGWTRELTERDMKEIEFSILYQDRFGHGTIGHNQHMIIATLAKTARDLGQDVITLSLQVDVAKAALESILLMNSDQAIDAFIRKTLKEMEPPDEATAQ